jgi:phosphoglycerate kinase
VEGLRRLGNLDVGGRRVLLRLDLNVPVDEHRRVTDDTRIRRALPTLTSLAERGARTVILSHFGRPGGMVAGELSLAPLQDPLSDALGADIPLAADCIGEAPMEVAGALEPGGFALFENLRFHAGEEANDPAFARALARAGERYVNDAFSVSHRAHASVVGLPALLPHAAGLAMEAELEALARALGKPERPLLAIVGGVKVSTKLALLGNLIAKVDMLAIGGAMANTFLAARGIDVGASLCEPDLLEAAREVLAGAEAAGCEVLLPVDAVVAGALEAGAEAAVVAVDAVPAEKMILDIGPESTDLIGDRILACRTVLWNGPLGAFEFPAFGLSTMRLARTTAAMTRAGTLTSVAGGGDTVAALALAGAVEGFSYVSTAGGAFLEWLEGRTLPGVAALMD